MLYFIYGTCSELFYMTEITEELQIGAVGDLVQVATNSLAPHNCRRVTAKLLVISVKILYGIVPRESEKWLMLQLLFNCRTQARTNI